MILLAHILVIYCIAASAAFVVLALVGVRRCRQAEAREKLITVELGRRGDAMMDIGISLIVSEVKDQQDVQQWLSAGYAKYEVVLVGDFTQDRLYDQLTEHYSMTRVDFEPAGEVLARGIRGVYRSRQKRYRKLILVDRAYSTLADDYNCGVAVCSYEYVAAFDRWSSLTGGALAYLMEELYAHSSQRVYAIGSFRSGSLPRSSVAIIDRAMKKCVMGAGMGVMTGPGRYAGTAMLFEREAVVEAGGFGDSFFPDLELYHRLKRIVAESDPEAVALFIPRVTVAEGGSDRQSCTVVPSHNASGGYPVLSRAAILTYIVGTLALLAVAIAVGNLPVARMLGMALAITYFSCVIMGGLALGIAPRLLAGLQGKPAAAGARQIAALALYPFFAFYCIVALKNYVK